MKGIIDSLKRSTNSIYGIRQKIGAELVEVFILTRVWAGQEIGVGNPVDTVEKVEPTPSIKDFSQDIRIQEGGGLESGDVVLRGVSKLNYPKSETLETRTGQRDVEKFWCLKSASGEKDLYTVISTKEKHLAWDIQLRKVTTDTNILQTIGVEF